MYKTLCSPCTYPADCQIILMSPCLEIHSEWKNGKFNFVIIDPLMLGIIRVCIMYILLQQCYRLCTCMCSMVEWAQFVAYPLLCQKSKLASGRLCQKLNLGNKELTHPRTGFIFRRIKSLFHHSNWQHIFLISFNGTSKRGVMHYK